MCLLIELKICFQEKRKHIFFWILLLAKTNNSILVIMCEYCSNREQGREETCKLYVAFQNKVSCTFLWPVSFTFDLLKSQSSRFEAVDLFLLECSAWLSLAIVWIINRNIKY